MPPSETVERPTEKAGCPGERMGLEAFLSGLGTSWQLL